jgi:hypothetical protein
VTQKFVLALYVWRVRHDGQRRRVLDLVQRRSLIYQSQPLPLLRVQCVTCPSCARKKSFVSGVTASRPTRCSLTHNSAYAVAIAASVTASRSRYKTPLRWHEFASARAKSHCGAEDVTSSRITLAAATARRRATPPTRLCRRVSPLQPVSGLPQPASSLQRGRGERRPCRDRLLG